MKPLLSSAVLLLALCSINQAARADSELVTLKTGTALDGLVETSIAGVDTFVYTNTDVSLLGPLGVLSASTSVFTATYADVLGIGTLNVTDVCTSVDLLDVAPTPCQDFAFSFTNLTLGDASVIAAVGVGVAASVNANVADLDIAGATIAGGSGSFDVQNPPPPPSITPEPGSLSLMATGLLTAAGMIRRKMTLHNNPLAVINS
jgi:hypothetical protein